MRLTCCGFRLGARHCLYGILTLSLILGVPERILALDFGKIIRKIGKVSDEIPINQVDDVIQDSATSRAGRDLLEKAGVRIDDATDRMRGLKNAWREILGDSDPSLLKQIDELPEPSQQAALVLAHGAIRVKSTIPDIATRSAFLRDGGADTLAAVGRYEDLVDDALRFDLAVRGGSLPSTAGARSLTLNDFGKFFQREQSRARHFWSTYVRPHWKLWLGASALAAVILAPEEYLDDIGNLTREGIRKLGTIGGKLLGNVLSGTLEGIGDGTKEVLRETFYSILTTFLSSVWGIVALFLLISCAVFAIPFTRGLALRVVKQALRKSSAKEDTGGAYRD